MGKQKKRKLKPPHLPGKQSMYDLPPGEYVYPLTMVLRVPDPNKDRAK
jgi:hypothetical protein